ncbi:hypothetical protein [Xylanimonas protaetiae]|uniref:Uncharacterized protein n=1 Tax=Xylanimonas protaetiae TaxID=2509457 RepID=A0A4P6F1G6_9MICO|nr:hypothetical protein [Xylanimonas protaetiae]QAY69066.1 hypothetical protein ET471_02585 [Xylanimonas protaetiae]
MDRVPGRDAPEQAPRQQRDAARVTRPETPLPVRVWVTQRQTGTFEADGLAVAWTDRQVEVRYDDPHGREGFVWVWASAVTRRPAA